MRTVVEVSMSPTATPEIILRVVAVENSPIFLFLFLPLFSLIFPSSLHRIVLLTTIAIILKNLPKPLQKFQIILILTFD